MPLFGSKEGTPSNRQAVPVRVHNGPPSGKHPPTPLFASVFGVRHKKQSSAPLQTMLSECMDDSNGIDYTNSHQRTGSYTSAFHPVGKLAAQPQHNGPSCRRQSMGADDTKQSSSFFHRLTRRKNPVSMSTPSSPATSRKHFFSFGSSDNRSASSKPEAKEVSNRPNSATPTTQPQQLSFAQRIKLHKGMRTTGRVPFEFLQSSKSQQQLATEKRQQKEALKRDKAFSADALNQLDPDYLTEALLAIGDVQPIVARSIPKHTVLIKDPQKTEERLRRDCLYEDEFYDKMLADSLLVCDLLQTHLSDCIAEVRAKSPSALSSLFTSPPQTPSMSRSQSFQPLFVGERRSALSPSSPVPNRVTMSMAPGNGYVGTGTRSISTVDSGVVAGPIPVATVPQHAGRSISSTGSNCGIGYGWKAGALGQFPIGGSSNSVRRNVGIRSAAISVAPNAASLPPLSPAMSLAARKKLSNVHFAP